VLAVIVTISLSTLTPLNSVYASKVSAHSHPVIRVKRTSELVGVNLQVYSTNWAGYAISEADVQNVVGTWIQPTVNCANGGYVANWVGIDGYTSTTVEQTGTLVECISGTPVYLAWYEFYPSPLTEITSITVHPGDTMYAQVYPSGGQYVVVLTDETTGATYTTSATVSSAQDNSAEWITEAPSSSSGVLPLANYGTAYFGPDYTGIASGTATINGVTGSIGSFGTAVEQIDMVNSANNVISLTSALTADGESFTDTFQSGTTTTSTTTTTVSSTTTTTVPTTSTTTSTSSTTTSVSTTTTTTTATSTSTSLPTLKVTVTSITGLYYYVFVSFTVKNSATGKGVVTTATAVLTAPNGVQSTGSLTTSSSGKGEFEIIALQEGTYIITITASASGYTSGSTTVQFIVTGLRKP